MPTFYERHVRRLADARSNDNNIRRVSSASDDGKGTGQGDVKVEPVSEPAATDTAASQGGVTIDPASSTTNDAPKKTRKPRQRKAST